MKTIEIELGNGSGSEYLTSTNAKLVFTNWEEELLAEHVLQRFRDVWVVTGSYPFLAIDEAQLRDRMSTAKGKQFVVLTPATMFQNISPEDLRNRLVTSLAGPGLSASSSPSSEYLVEGEANPKARFCYRWNALLRHGTQPFVAAHTHYVASESGSYFQRTFAELVAQNNMLRPDSAFFDFTELARQAHEFHLAHLGPHLARPPEIARMLDAIFTLNAAAIAAAEQHHATAARTGPRFTEPAPRLTRYGRLVHLDGDRLVETSFALLHYEKALHEFEALKKATAQARLDHSYMHGVYCVVAVAASIEAIANRLWYDERGTYPHADNGKAVDRVMGAARRIANKQGKQFNAMGSREPSYEALERVRGLRNSFIHATEEGAEIDPQGLTSIQLAEVDEHHCRHYLLSLRTFVAFVFDQLTWMTRPISTDTRVQWLSGLEIP